MAYTTLRVKDVTNLFLTGGALLCKHYAKDQDTLIEQIEQSFICVYQQLMALPYKKLPNKNDKN